MHTELNRGQAVQNPNWDERTDDRLLACMAHGNDEEKRCAFDSFYRRHRDYLYGICYNLANRYQFGFFDHEDIFQSTMIKALQRAETFKAERGLGAQELEDKADAWLGGIAENVVLDFFRRTPKCVVLDPELLDGDGPEEETSLRPAQPADAGEVLDDTEQIKLIREAIDTLAPLEQAVMWASNQFNECRKHQRTPTEELDEIVASLGISRSNYRKLKQRAREKIQAYITIRTRNPDVK